MVIARKLGPGGYGLLSTVTAFVGLFSIFHLSGFDRVLLRECVASPEDEEMLRARTLGLKIAVGLLGMVVANAALFLFTDYSAEKRILAVLFSITLITQSINSLLTTVFQIHEDMRWLTIGNLLRQTFYIVFAGAGLWIGLWPSHPTAMVMTVLVASYVFITVFYVVTAIRITGHPLRVAWPRLKFGFIKSGIIFSLATLVVYLYTKVDILIASAFVSTASVGLYAVALNAVDRLTSPLAVVLTAFFPSAVRRIHENKGADMRSVRRISLAFGAVAIGMALLGGLFASWAVPLVLGKGYDGAVAPLRALLWAMVPGIAMMPYVTAVQASRHEDAILRLAPLRAGLNVALDFVTLSLGFGIVGMAWGSVITSVVFNAVFLRYASARLRTGIHGSGGEAA